MQKEQGNKRPKHAAKDTKSYDEVNPDRKVVRSIRSITAYAITEAVQRITFLVRSASYVEDLGCHTNKLARITIHAQTAVAPRYDIDKLTPTNSVRSIWSIFHHAGRAGGYVRPHAYVIEADRAVKIESFAAVVGKLGEVGRWLALVITVELTRTIDGQQSLARIFLVRTKLTQRALLGNTGVVLGVSERKHVSSASFSKTCVIWGTIRL